MAKKKKDLPVFAIVEMPKWKTKILDVITSILFPRQKYFVLTVTDTSLTTDTKGKYTDKTTGTSIEL